MSKGVESLCWLGLAGTVLVFTHGMAFEPYGIFMAISYVILAREAFLGRQ